MGKVLYDNTQRKGYKLLMLMAMLYVTADLASCALNFKFVQIDWLFFSAETLIFPITYAIADIVAEVYGYSVARKLVWIVLLCDTLFSLITSILVHIPSPTAVRQHAYHLVFADLLRGSVAEIAGVLCGIFVNIYTISKLKILAKGRYFWLRSITSSTLGEAVLVLVAMPIAFWGQSSLKELLILMLFSYLYKIVFAIVAAYPATLVVRVLKRVEQIDVYDYDVDFNPFAVFKLESSD